MGKKPKSPPKETDTKWEMEISHSMQVAGLVVIILVAVALMATLAHFDVVHVKFGSTPEHETTLDPKQRPVEFLYLDGGRVLTYLEEIQGGNITSEEQSRRRTNTLTATLNFQHTLESGSSSEEEELIQRSVSPTAASSYFELVKDLEAGDKIKRVKWFCYASINHLDEGQFVRFTTGVVRPPIYLDPYLAVRQNAKLTALFPEPTQGTASSQAVSAERSAAKDFSRQIGGDPRIVFSLRWRHPAESRCPKRTKKSAAIQYLLPLRYRQLTDEGSLIQDGGGEVNVLGKIVRILPERDDPSKKFTYIDSPTRETWRGPLHQAADALLCRSDPACEKEVRAEGNGGTTGGDPTREARSNMERALINQTEIHKRGAVVVPLAIYK